MPPNSSLDPMLSYTAASDATPFTFRTPMSSPAPARWPGRTNSGFRDRKSFRDQVDGCKSPVFSGVAFFFFRRRSKYTPFSLRWFAALAWLSLFGLNLATAQETGPRLLLTSRRLHRLKLDRQRQTDRWINFEQRVKTTPESPQRGFELALYYVVTGDESTGKAAAAWAAAHPLETEQRLLVADWCAPALRPEDREKLSSAAPETSEPADAARNLLFQSVLRGQDPSAEFKTAWDAALKSLKEDPSAWQPEQLYSLYEAIAAMQMNFHTDLRRENSDLFSQLPAVFLLSLSPKQLEQPTWRTRMAGLIMVNVDPNLQASSFVQGWAMEDPKEAKEGPGVGYEFLWADPYLPGLGYFNMGPWVYLRDAGFLIARTGWEPEACSIKQTPAKFESLHCDASIRSRPANFGKLVLLPVSDPCVLLKPDPSRTTILSGLRPGSEVSWKTDGKTRTGVADASGLLRLPFDAVGRICRSR
jgi:hypothetical protein